MSIDLTKLPDPPMPSYTFTLFSRDLFEKPKFKDYDSLLESKLSRSKARVSHLASILGNGNSIGANKNQTRPHIDHESKSADVKVLGTTSTHYVGPVYLYFRNPGHASATKDMRVLTKSHEPRSVVSEPSPTAPYDVDLSDDMFDEDDMLDMF
ncbi:hypothetical protein FXO38_28551 [Capsicum annuum]|nr:hypothetical protein FXO38_28551 [Capsicum annuum]